MPKRCPPGVICIENITIIFALLIVCGVLVFMNMKTRTNNIIIKEQQHSTGIFPQQGYGFSNLESDVLMNPYNAPLKDNRVNPIGNLDPRGTPINIPTQGVNSPYRQVGILTRLNGDEENILPLMGKPLITSRDKWNYYTMTDKNNMIKLPITHKGKSGTSEYCCDSLYNGDTIYVEGYNDAFKVTMYENNTMQYIPHL